MAGRNLILTGGVGHPFADSACALAEILAAGGIQSDVTDDIEGGLIAVGRGDFDLVTVYALRWRMLDNPKYASLRPRWGFSLSNTGRAILDRHVRGGKGLLGLHTACICFDDWPDWRELLGATWAWGQSFHPPCGPLSAVSTDTAHVITADISGFTLDRDEVYGALAVMPDVAPLMVATASASSEPGRSWPSLWAREVGRGRVVYDALGHDRSSFEVPQHRRILIRAALWGLSRPDREISMI